MHLREAASGCRLRSGLPQPRLLPASIFSTSLSASASSFVISSHPSLVEHHPAMGEVPVGAGLERPGLDASDASSHIDLEDRVGDRLCAPSAAASSSPGR